MNKCQIRPRAPDRNPAVGSYRTKGDVKNWKKTKSLLSLFKDLDVREGRASAEKECMLCSFEGNNVDKIVKRLNNDKIENQHGMI